MIARQRESNAIRRLVGRLRQRLLQSTKEASEELQHTEADPDAQEGLDEVHQRLDHDYAQLLAAHQRWEALIATYPEEEEARRQYAETYGDYVPLMEQATVLLSTLGTPEVKEKTVKNTPFTVLSNLFQSRTSDNPTEQN